MNIEFCKKGLVLQQKVRHFLEDKLTADISHNELNGIHIIKEDYVR